MPYRKEISNNQYQISTNIKSRIRHLKLEIGNWKFKEGFTLIEILVALFVVVILGILLLTTSGTITQRHSSNLQSIAAKVASKEIERLRDIGYSQLPTSDPITGDPDLAKLPSANAQRTITNYLDAPEIKLVSITVSWQLNGANRQVLMETLIYQYGL